MRRFIVLLVLLLTVGSVQADNSATIGTGVATQFQNKFLTFHIDTDSTIIGIEIIFESVFEMNQIQEIASVLGSATDLGDGEFRVNFEVSPPLTGNNHIANLRFWTSDNSNGLHKITMTSAKLETTNGEYDVTEHGGSITLSSF